MLKWLNNLELLNLKPLNLEPVNTYKICFSKLNTYNIGYFIGMRNKPPRFDHYNYIEKAKYLSLIWGTVVMAITGLILWFPQYAILFCPKLSLILLLSSIAVRHCLPFWPLLSGTSIMPT